MLSGRAGDMLCQWSDDISFIYRETPSGEDGLNDYNVQ